VVNYDERIDAIIEQLELAKTGNELFDDLYKVSRMLNKLLYDLG
jgi:hypothetical protein